MAKTQVTLNAEEFIRDLTKVQESLHNDIMYGITSAMDRIRKTSGEQMIIPRRGQKPTGNAQGFKRGMIRLYKDQPSHSTKLTERTGMLKQILLSAGTWTRSIKQMRLKASKHLVFWVKPQKEGNDRSYIAMLSIMEKGDVRIKYRIMNETTGESVKGKKRPFFEPALKAEKPYLEKEIQIPIRKLRRV